MNYRHYDRKEHREIYRRSAKSDFLLTGLLVHIYTRTHTGRDSGTDTGTDVLLLLTGAVILSQSSLARFHAHCRRNSEAADDREAATAQMRPHTEQMG